MQRALPRSTLWVLGALSAFGPLSTDMYLPALPAVARTLHISSSLAQLTLSVSLFGLAAGQLLAGPVSDARGRRRPLLAGLLAYIAASVGCAAAPSVGPLLALRFLQGLAGGGGIAIARAVVRDRASGLAAARTYAALMVVGGLGPIVAPIAGGLLLHVTDWRGIFATLAVIGAVILFVAIAFVPESLAARDRHPGGIGGAGGGLRVLARDPGYVGPTVAAALAFGTLMAYIAASPFVLERIHGLSPQQFSLVFATNGAGIMLFRQLATWSLRHRPPQAMLAAALGCQALGAAGVLVTVTLGLGLAPLLICLFIAAGSIGGAVPMATALAMEHHARRAGSASGAFGFLQFAVGSAIAPLVGIAGPHSALPLAIAMPACSSGALLALGLTRLRAPLSAPADAT